MALLFGTRVAHNFYMGPIVEPPNHVTVVNWLLHPRSLFEQNLNVVNCDVVVRFDYKLCIRPMLRHSVKKSKNLFLL